MTDNEKRTADRLTRLMTRLSEQDVGYLMAYGEGMANKAERMISTTDSAAGQERR